LFLITLIIIQKIGLFIFLFIAFCGEGYCQIGSIFRFGNVVYYKTDSLSRNKLTGTSITFDNEIKNRYFDLFLKADSIQVYYNGNSYFFYQKTRIEPKNHQEIILYKNRYLTNNDLVIKLLKLKDIDQKFIIANAKIINKNSLTQRKENAEILLPLDEIEGIFLGSGKNLRKITYGTAIISSIIVATLIIIQAQ
jgi:hypothetical protein